MHWSAHKFGGTSVASAERYRRVADILESRASFEPRRAVVVSAMGGVTDALLGLVDAAVARESYDVALATLRARLLGVVVDLAEGELATALTTRFIADLEDIADLLRACHLLRDASKATRDLIAGYGELWSAQTLHALLEARGVRAAWLDARDVLRVQPRDHVAPGVRVDESQALLDAWLTTYDLDRDLEILVITGFIASDPDGLPTTLGRNGSDYSAAIFSALLAAPELCIWTDVDGVMSANPRQVPEAQVLPGLSYREAMELAYFGAKVLHPSTIAPAVARDVVVWIKNTFAPEVRGTRIAAQTTPDRVVKGFASIDSMSLLNLEGSDLIGVPGIAERLFGALKAAGVSVVMISQGSSEHSICFVVPDHHAERAREVVEHAFFAERHQGQLRDLQVTPGCSVLAAVGDGMSGTPGVAARFFTALANAGVSVRAIAQGSSERNISVVVDGPDAQRALRAAHAAHFLSPQTLSIGLIGAGGVGSELLSQLAREADHLREQFDLSLRVRAICDSQRMILDDAGIDLASDWRARLADGEQLDLEAFVAHVDAPHLPHAALVDCTSSQAVADRYLGWLERTIHVITPNKKASSGDLDTWRALRAQRRAHYLHETTVGAGLPIVHTARELVQTGDRFRRVEGIFSGTLSYLFNTYDAQTPFSELVRQARGLGYTEPDPRDDLSGADVARKLVILSREAGADLSLDLVTVSSLVPSALVDCSVDVFLERLAEHDDAIAARYAEAAERGEVLRFVGTFDAATMEASVKLGSYPTSHPFARVQKTDNIVQLTTDRYADNPLVIQGPGAGPGVTAAGVFADLLRLASYLGARR